MERINIVIVKGLCTRQKLQMLGGGAELCLAQHKEALFFCIYIKSLSLVGLREKMLSANLRYTYFL
jgi:hypothetical protein